MYQAKIQVFSNKYLHSLAIIQRKNVGTLFDRIPETQRKQCLCDNKLLLPYLGHVILCLLGFTDADWKFLAKKLQWNWTIYHSHQISPKATSGYSQIEDSFERPQIFRYHHHSATMINT